ncbi:MAG: DUF2846 domain-containing protein [Gallionella sp.]|nr:DUF2846 domain-containing protein [Gallionella sp.]
MIQKMKFVTLAFVIGVILTGCASAPGAKFSGLENVPPSTAELIIYRQSAFFAMGQSMPVLVDGNKVGELYNGSYLQQPITPGNHAIKVTTGAFGKSAEANVQIAAGERKFLHFDFVTGPLANIFFVGDSLKERSGADAMVDLKTLSSAKPEIAGKQN